MKRLLVHYPASGCVDEDRFFFHHPEGIKIKEVIGLIIEGDMNRYIVAYYGELPERDGSGAIFLKYLALYVWIEGKESKGKSLKPLSYLSRSSSVSYKAHVLSHGSANRILRTDIIRLEV